MKLDWQKNDGLIPAIIQDCLTGQVYMLGYMNEDAYEKTVQDQYVWFYSRSKNRLWKKGETSGNFLKLKDIKIDCDIDSLLVSVEPVGPVCHTGKQSCFDTDSFGFDYLYKVIEDRKINSKNGSYTCRLLNDPEMIVAKVEEESAEVVNAFKNESKQRLIEESVDLLYHLSVMCVSKGISLEELYEEIDRRKS